VKLLYPLQNEDFNVQIINEKVEKNESNELYTVSVTLKNNTNDTLRYYTMSCSWWNFYSVDNHDYKIKTDNCDKNIAKILKLAPHKSNTINIILTRNIEQVDQNKQFRIGFRLVKAKDTAGPLDFFQPKEDYILWSNKI